MQWCNYDHELKDEMFYSMRRSKGSHTVSTSLRNMFAWFNFHYRLILFLRGVIAKSVLGLICHGGNKGDCLPRPSLPWWVGGGGRYMYMQQDSHPVSTSKNIQLSGKSVRTTALSTSTGSVPPSSVSVRPLRACSFLLQQS